jgi:hypothetical protein
MKSQKTDGYDTSQSPTKPYSANSRTGAPKRSSEFDSVRNVRQSLIDRKGFIQTARPYADVKAFRISRGDRMNRQADKKLAARKSH